jgi:hypothetical protein
MGGYLRVDGDAGRFTGSAGLIMLGFSFYPLVASSRLG